MISAFYALSIEDVGELIRQSSDRLYSFSTDYPHAEGGAFRSGGSKRASPSIPNRRRRNFSARTFATWCRKARAVEILFGA